MKGGSLPTPAKKGGNWPGGGGLFTGRAIYRLQIDTRVHGGYLAQ